MFWRSILVLKGTAHFPKLVSRSLNLDLVEKILHDIKKNIGVFSGFNWDDFSYFLDHQNWKKEIVRRKLEKLANEIQKSISTRASFLKDHEIRVQTIRKDYAGLNIFKGSKHTKTKHYSIGIGAGKFSVYIQIPSVSLVRSFVRKARSEGEEFLTLISQLPDYSIELYSRTSKIGRPLPGGTIYKRVLTMNNDAISVEILQNLMNLIENIPYPAVNFNKHCDLDSLGFEIKKDDAINFIFQTINELGPIYGYIP